MEWQWMCIPFAWTDEAVGDAANQNWIGTVETRDLGAYIDTGLLLVFGGIPWQVRASSTPSSSFPLLRSPHPRRSFLSGLLPEGSVQQIRNEGATAVVRGSDRVRHHGHPSRHGRSHRQSHW